MGERVGKGKMFGFAEDHDLHGASAYFLITKSYHATAIVILHYLRTSSGRL